MTTINTERLDWLIEDIEEALEKYHEQILQLEYQGKCTYKLEEKCYDLQRRLARYQQRSCNMEGEDYVDQVEITDYTIYAYWKDEH